MKLLSGIVCLLVSTTCLAFSWDSLWWNQNQRGFTLLQQQQYQKAADTFSDPVWKAAAAYKAGDYAEAAALYGKSGQEKSYNLGNALAHQGQYEAAIKACEAMLRLQPNHADAQFNKKLVEELLKQQQNQQEQNQQKQDQQKQDQQKQDQQKQDQQKQDQQKQDQQKQDQQKQDQQKQDQQKQDQQKQDQQKQDQQKQNQQKQDQQKQDQQKQDQPDKNQSLSDKEKKAASEQWLQLIPDDPGGLMRQKFLRDYLKRHRHSPLEANP